MQNFFKICPQLYEKLPTDGMTNIRHFVTFWLDGSKYFSVIYLLSWQSICLNQSIISANVFVCTGCRNSSKIRV